MEIAINYLKTRLIKELVIKLYQIILGKIKLHMAKSNYVLWNKLDGD